MKTIVTILLLAVSGLASSSHYHAWAKMNETQGTDGYGNQVTICSWKCISDYQNPHFTQTQGSGYCPMPY